MFDAIVDDFLFYFEVGGYVMPPLVGLTVLLWYALGYRLGGVKRGSKRSVRNLIDRYEKGQEGEPQGIIEAAVAQGLTLARAGRPHLRRFLDDAFSDLEQELKKYSVLTRTIVMVAPVLGLLGTVTGMIETFDSLQDMALFTQSGGIAGGISQALFTTQMGLAVAIPGLIVHRMLERKQRRMEMELAQVKDILCARYG